MTLVTMFCLLFSVPAFARTNVWTTVYNSGGKTSYAEQTMVGGMDWTEGLGPQYSPDGSSPWTYPPSPEMTAYVFEQFDNKGSVYMEKAMETAAPWELEEYKFIQGSGKTKIFKHVEVWTEDSRYDDDDKLWYPTHAWVEVDFSTPKPFWDAESWEVLMDEREAQDEKYGEPGQIASFDKIIKTDEDFVFQQKVGINNWPSDFCPPRPPEPREMHWINGP